MFYTMGGKLGLNPTSFWPERLAAIGFDPGGIRVGAFIFRGAGRHRGLPAGYAQAMNNLAWQQREHPYNLPACLLPLLSGGPVG